MADLSYTVEAKGVEDIEKLVASLGKLENVLGAAKGSGKALEEMRRILLGFKGQGPIFQELDRSIKGLNSTVTSMSSSITNSISAMTRVMRSEFRLLTETLTVDAANAAAVLPKSMSKSLDETQQVVAKGYRNITAKVKAEQTALYEAMVMKNPNMKVTQKGLESLVELSAKGATLSPYHKSLVDSWKKSSEAASTAIKDTESVFTRNLIRSRSDQAKQLEDQLRSEAKQVEQFYKNKTATEKVAIEKYYRDIKASVNLATAAAQGSYTTLSAKGGPGKEVNSFAESLRAVNQKMAGEASSQLSLLKQQNAQEQTLYRERITRLKSLGDETKRILDTVKQRQDKSYNDELAYQRNMVKLATTRATGSYSSLGSQNYGKLITPKIGSELAGEMGAGASKAKDLDSAFKKLAISGNDVHSMSRGLASGFNLLWLTWGNLVPLLTGAAISNGFMQVAKQGMEVAYTLEIVAALGPATSGEISTLTDELVRLGTSGPFGPRAVAEAMKTLSLAGLEAQKIVSVMPTVLNFSLAGDTTIQNAADVLVSVTTAFGTGAEGFQRSADIITRAAADSKASVESFGEAMKLASVVGEQFGARQEDVAVMIQYMANLGIQGTAAGTAIRNLFADLSGRTSKTSKILAQMGVDFMQADGKMKPMLQTVKELSVALNQYDAKSQKNLLAAVLSERGGKAMIELLVKYRQAASEGSEATSKLQEDIEKLENAAADSTIAAIKLGQTTSNAFKTAAATFETTLFKAFETIEPQLYMIANAMQQAFGSDAMQAALTGIATAIARIIEYAVQHQGTMALILGSFLGFRAAAALTATVMQSWAGLATTSSGILAVLTGRKVADTAATAANTGAVTANTTALTAQAGAERALGIAQAGRMAGLIRLLPGIGTAVSLAAVAWSLYDMWINKAGSSSADFAETKADKMVEAMEKEAAKIREVNALRDQGLSKIEAEQRLLENAEKANIDRARRSEVGALQDSVDKDNAEMLRLQG